MKTNENSENGCMNLCNRLQSFMQAIALLANTKIDKTPSQEGSV
jgi:hypothetical protein